MRIARVAAVYFSPTGRTRQVATMLAESLAEQLGADLERIDITTPRSREQELSFAGDVLVVLATPTYAGRVPNKIAPELARLLHAEGAPCIAVTTFGNRNPDSSLIELAQIAREAGMQVIAAASMPVRHAFSDKLAGERPDEGDRRLLEQLASDAVDLLARVQGADDITQPLIRDGAAVGDYYRPLKEDGEPAAFLKAKPKTRADLCDACGACVAACPMGSIDAENPLETPGICIKCQACIRICPHGAKHFDDVDFLSHVRMLEANYTRACEPEVYLGSIVGK